MFPFDPSEKYEWVKSMSPLLTRSPGWFKTIKQTQPVFTCSKSTMETPDQCVQYV